MGKQTLQIPHCRVHGIVIIHTNTPKNHLEEKKRVLDNGKELKCQTNRRRKEMENPQSDLWDPAVTPDSRTVAQRGL